MVLRMPQQPNLEQLLDHIATLDLASISVGPVTDGQTNYTVIAVVPSTAGAAAELLEHMHVDRIDRCENTEVLTLAGPTKADPTVEFEIGAHITDPAYDTMAAAQLQTKYGF
jgi:hypothetical protein